MKKGILFILLLISPVLIIVFAFGFLFLMIFMNADSGDSLDKLYENDEEMYGVAMCSESGQIDQAKWYEVWGNEAEVGLMMGYEDLVLDHSKEVGIDPVLFMAIMQQETGRGQKYNGEGKEQIISTHNNPAGIMDWENNWSTARYFPTLEDGIKYSIENIGRLILEKGLVDLDSLGSHYAPLDAANDPGGLNKHWIPSVTDFANKLGGFTMNCTVLGGESYTEDLGSYKVEIKNGHAWMTPHSKNLTSGVGPRWGGQHRGIDIAYGGILGTPTVSMYGGKVIKVHTGCPYGYYGSPCGGGYGNHVFIDHGGGLITRYAHLQDVYTRVGQQVQVGQLLGTVGSSGSSTGAHLHFEIRQGGLVIDPEVYLRSKGFVIPIIN